MIGVLTDKIHRFLARSAFVVTILRKVRNQANCVIKYYLTEDAHDRMANGEELLIRTLARRARRFVDVGANVGNWTDFFLRHAAADCAGLLIEPSGQSFQSLQGRYGHEGRLEIVNAAASEEVGTCYFYEEPNCGQTSSIEANLSLESAVKKDVRVTTVDSECQRKGWNHVDFLKIDAEGFDLKVIRGTRDLIHRASVDVIMFEYGAGHAWAKVGDTLAGAFRFFEAEGYSVYLLKADGLYVLDYAKWGEFGACSNFVALSPQKKADAAPLMRGKI